MGGAYGQILMGSAPRSRGLIAIVGVPEDASRAREVKWFVGAPCYPDNEPVKSPAEPMVRRLSGGGRRIRTAGPTYAQRAQ